MALKSLIFEGQVRHKRYHQKKHQFKYNVFNMLIDIDDLKYLDKNLNLFSFNKFNIFSFYEKDHGLKNGTPVKDWILEVISKSDIDIAYVTQEYWVMYLILLQSGQFMTKKSLKF